MLHVESSKSRGGKENKGKTIFGLKVKIPHAF